MFLKRKKIPENIIKYPRFIYRYRTLSLKSLTDVKNNKLTFSTSNYYDDPFDTFLRINKTEIRDSIKNIFSQKGISEQIKLMLKILNVPLDEKNIETYISHLDLDKFSNQVIDFMKGDIRNELRKKTLSCCFSESGVNEALWIKYANQHKGFVMIYDTMTFNNFYPKGVKEKCKKCDNYIPPFSLYPIYYSNKPYNATEYAKWFSADYALIRSTSKVDASLIESSFFPRMYWEKEKIVLIKKNCHKYDQEWRLISSEWSENPISFECRPYGIILGLNMSSEDKDMVYNNGKLAGIEHFYECYIDDKDDLKYREYKD